MTQKLFNNLYRLSLVAVFLSLSVNLHASEDQDLKITYQMPSQAVADLVDAQRSPSVSLSPDRTLMLILNGQELPDIERLAQPELRLAGLRINPETNGNSRSSYIETMELQRLDDNSIIAITGLPDNPSIGSISWSPDGRYLSFSLTKLDRIEHWVADTQTGEAGRIGNYELNEAPYGSAVRWLADSKSFIIRSIPAGRDSAPEPNLAPTGPVIQQNIGRSAPARTYQDLLKDRHDESLFDYYFTSQLLRADLDGNATTIGQPAVYTSISSSPDGQYLLVSSLHRPYSYTVPAFRFPTNVEVWDTDGELIHTVASLPLADDIPIAFNSVRTGPRSVSWRADAPASLSWVEALDEGDSRIEAEYRDRVLLQDAPFTSEPRTLATLEFRYSGMTWGTDDLALIREGWREDRLERTWSVKPGQDDPQPHLVLERSTEDRYNHPGTPRTISTGTGHNVLQISDDGTSLFMAGQGASPEGNRPFLDRFNIETGESERLWRSESPYYEIMISLLDDGNTMITRRETNTEQPNFYLRDLLNDTISQLTEFPHPTPDLIGVTRELIQYTRADGVQLSGNLYLPPGYSTDDGPLPTIIWAYPREFRSSDAAGQISGSPYSFNNIGYWGPHFLLLEGYAVLNNATMPIVGEEGEDPNDRFVEQLVTSAEAAIDELVSRGVTDRHRVAVGGHSYGAFMTANLLAHSDLFAAGIARSGAYNRTLTPFGFQAEPRNYWDAPEVYLGMSPFMNAHKIKTPILLIHGDSDNNSGTFPMQSERLYNAIAGLGGTARLVMLPHESHGYRARESVMHMLWETTEWLNRFVRDREVPATTTYETSR